jgi:arylsulfatase
MLDRGVNLILYLVWPTFHLSFECPQTPFSFQNYSTLTAPIWSRKSQLISASFELPPFLQMPTSRPNILYVMTDQQRFDTIAALGANFVHTPNLDRLVRRGISCTNAYSTCPVCVPARYTIMTGCEPSQTGWFSNWQETPDVRSACGPYLAETLADRGYRTWGLGKFHTEPRHEPLGFEVHEYSEELWPTESDFLGDDYVAWLRERAPALAHLEQVHGERSDMYYMPQLRPMAAELTGEAWVTGRAIDEINVSDERPFFGFVSFVPPHPPIAPPVPYNRMFDPDQMPSPRLGNATVDAADDYLGWMNYAVWAEDISPTRARQIRARYFGEIAFIDDCIGKILDAVEARPDADNTLICFFSDHGDHLGDHGAWQKESFFEESCRVPYLVSWPAGLPSATLHEGLVTLTDLFSLATSASGVTENRDGQDILAAFQNGISERDEVLGLYGTPGTSRFKAMWRTGEWKYIWLANGGREMLFNLQDDPGEERNLMAVLPDQATQLRNDMIEQLTTRESTRAALSGGQLMSLPFESFPRIRIKQFARGVTDFNQPIFAK